MPTKNCPQCGEEIDRVGVNGYGYGGRLLEDVDFWAVFQEDGGFKYEQQGRYGSYLEPINMDYFYKKFTEGLRRGDEVFCPKCKGELRMKEDGEFYKAFYMEIPLHRGTGMTGMGFVDEIAKRKADKKEE